MNTAPWKGLGRRTPAQTVAERVLPLGLLPFDPKNPPPTPAPSGDLAADLKQLLLRISGSAICVGDRKVLTTQSALDALHRKRANPYLLLTQFREGAVAQMALRIVAGISYVNPTYPQTKFDVDAAVLHHAELPAEYDLHPVEWGDSTSLGVGDSVMVVGFPLGTDLFLEHRYNRGIVQPTVYAATVGAIVPALLPTQTRLLRLTVPGIGGLSGGAVFDPQNGNVLGMVTTAIHANELPQPVLYAIPSEILQPFAQVEFVEKAE